MKSNKNIRVILIVLISFVTYYILSQNFKSIKTTLDSLTHQGLISYILTYLIVGIPIFIGTYLINRKISLLENLGLSKHLLHGIGISLLFTLPMFLGGLIFFHLNDQLSTDKLIAGTLLAGFMEELYFRGFLFGQLFKYTRLGFIPSIFFGALLFASGHLYQSQNISELIGIFAITFLGAILFAWLYAEWKYNLWVPIFTHTFMNLSWTLFDYDNTALGSAPANIFRGLTIFIAIVGTIQYKKRTSQKFEIIRKTLWLKNIHDKIEIDIAPTGHTA